MSKIVRMTSETPLSATSLERIDRLGEMPDDTINTTDIPERRFDLALARKRRREGWRPGKAVQKQAS